ncbi:MAG: nicotinamide-nucleotide adenylyltransferase [Candidatus Thermoplasmatota archaeon]
MNALFIGRFQPFHNGHLQVIQHIYKKYTNIFIGIGSSQYANTRDNPFSYEERKQMIHEALSYNNIKNFEILPIPDIHNPPKWVDHVTSIISNFQVVITNNELTKQLFEQQGFPVVNTPQFQRQLFSGKEIRNRMIHDQEWKTLVPKPVADIIVKIQGVERIKQLF